MNKPIPDIENSEYNETAKAKNVVVYGQTTSGSYVPLLVGTDGSVLSNYVPYTGATKDVDLGSKKLTANEVNTNTYNANGGTNLFSWDGSEIDVWQNMNFNLNSMNQVDNINVLTISAYEISSSSFKSDFYNAADGTSLFSWDGSEIDVAQDLNLGANDLTAGAVNTDNYKSANKTSLFYFDGSEIVFQRNINASTKTIYANELRTDTYNSADGTSLFSWDSVDSEIDVGQNMNLGSNDLFVNSIYSAYTSASNYLISDTLNAFSTPMTLLNWDSSTLNLMPNAEADIELFANADVGNDEDGKKLRLWRRAAEGDTYMDFYIDSSNKGYIKLYTSSSTLYLDPISANGDVILKVNGTGNLRIGNNAGGDFYVGGDGAVSKLLAVYNDMIFGWSRRTSTGSHTIKFQGTNNNGTFTYFQVSGDLNSRLTEFFGTSEFGGTTNYATFSSNGQLTLVGTARVRRNVEIAIGSIKPPATHPASWVDLGIAGAWKFSDGTTETVILVMPLPLDIDRTGDVIAYIEWASPSTTGNCVWELSYLMRSEDEPIDAEPDDTLQEIVGSSSTAKGLVTTSFTIPAADISDTDKLLILKLERIGGDASDTLGDVAYLTAMNFNYVSNKLGESLV